MAGVSRRLSTLLPETVALYAHTVARMNPRQVAGIGERKTRELLVPRLPVDFDAWYERRIPSNLTASSEPIAADTATLRDSLSEATRERHRREAREAAAGDVTFMNRRVDVAGGGDVDWYDERFDDLPRLWRLKLYGFEPLSRVVTGFEPGDPDAADLRETFDDWIRDWMASVEIGGPRYLRRAWTPYAVSLRVLNWTRYVAWRRAENGDSRDAAFESALLRELYKSAAFLRNHIERDVGGNHLVENGAALVAAGLLFGDDGRDWVDVGLSILGDAGATQFLSDGCHFERSPMYHVLTLTRYVTACSLLSAAGRPVPDGVRDPAVRATDFLEYLRPPDGQLPLLNDSVHGQSLSLDACLRYARATGLEPADDEDAEAYTDAVGRSLTDTSGYRWLRTDAGAMLVDGGPVGPPHLPGHAHSDVLSFLLWVDGSPVVTDTGTFDYEGGPRRTYSRGVAGHNTVQVGDSEPISLGGRFLMGPRPTPVVRFQGGPVTLFEGRYESASFEGAAYAHHRAFYARDRGWTVWDRVRGHEGHPVRSRLHLSPDIEATDADDGSVRLRRGDTPVARVHPLGDVTLETIRGWYYPRFGEAVERPVLAMRVDEHRNETAAFGFHVAPGDRPEAVTETRTENYRLAALSVDGEEYSLPETRLAVGR